MTADRRRCSTIAGQWFTHLVEQAFGLRRLLTRTASRSSRKDDLEVALCQLLAGVCDGFIQVRAAPP
jgi:hypothetical protein